MKPKPEKRKVKACSGCGSPFLTYRDYDYCADCAVNNNRYLSRNSNCSECDGRGIIKFKNQKPRPCKLCSLTKKSMTKEITKKLTAEEQFEQNEIQFLAAVEEESKNLIAGVIERNLPISATPNVFDLEKDVNYRILLRTDTPQYYYDNEDYQAKITNN